MFPRVEIDPDTGVRLVRSTACRMVQEEEGIKVTLEPSKNEL